VTLVGAEPHPPYDRPPLSKQILAGRWEADRLAPRAADHLAGLCLDPGACEVQLADGAQVGCEALVIVTGVQASTTARRRRARAAHAGRRTRAARADRPGHAPGGRPSPPGLGKDEQGTTTQALLRYASNTRTLRWSLLVGVKHSLRNTF